MVRSPCKDAVKFGLGNRLTIVNLKASVNNYFRVKLLCQKHQRQDIPNSDNPGDLCHASPLWIREVDDIALRGGNDSQDAIFGGHCAVFRTCRGATRVQCERDDNCKARDGDGDNLKSNN